MDSSSRKAALERAAAALEGVCNALSAARYCDLRSDRMWECARAVCDEARYECEAARDFSPMLADDGLAAWRQWERCDAVRTRALERGTPEALGALCGEVDVAWSLYEDVRWYALLQLKSASPRKTLDIPKRGDFV